MQLCSGCDAGIYRWLVIHADPFAQARFLLDCGLIVAATAQTGIESYIRRALEQHGNWAGKVSRLEFRTLLSKLEKLGIVERPARNRLAKLFQRFGVAVHGRSIEKDELREKIESAAALCRDVESAADGDRLVDQLIQDPN